MISGYAPLVFIRCVATSAPLGKEMEPIFIANNRLLSILEREPEIIPKTLLAFE
jgi:hypothetical protein